MKCPFCGYIDGKVLDSRHLEDRNAIRRRRLCVKCERRFTTYEQPETISTAVVKQDNSIQPYDRSKIIRGIMRACEKRPVSLSSMEHIADDVESELYKYSDSEISSTEIGEMVMKYLKKVDEVAYVRFASVHKHFSSIEDFMLELSKMLGEGKKEG